MATIKHISSKNADYGAAEQYLTFEHDEFTMKPVRDKAGRMVPREGYRIDTLNCGDEDFALSCLRANMQYKKNSQRQDIKSHHYIISFDPRDAADNGLTVEKAQELGMEYCKKHFPGHQALICTHPDGHNHSGNIHVHIVINSLRIHEVERKAYMDRPCDTQAGAKHRCTASAMRYFRSEVMEMCQREGLHQIDLLNGGREKITEREYWAKKRGQAEKDVLNKKMSADGLTPRQPKFETEKKLLRQSIRSVLSTAVSFKEYSAKLMQDYGIAVKESRGRYSYLTPDRTKPITARKLGTDFDKAAVLSILAGNASKTVQKEESGQNHRDSVVERLKRRKTPKTAPNQDSVQRMVDIPAKMSEGKGKGYEWWAKGFNLQQMSQTMIYLEECGFSCPEDVDTAIKESSDRQRELSKEMKSMEKRIADNKELIRQATVYRKTKPTYDGLKKARKPERYREENRADLALFEVAGRYFKEWGLTKFPAIAKIQAENESLLSRKNAIYSEYRGQKTKTEELRRVKSNIDVMLRQEHKPQRRQEQER
ncbi:MAG: relaxase/mobilization nuclease domain-containing protein [Dorea sp.]|nr:relaxase/mobilization nuclease domain-containing protein [Dorea sp.]